MYLLLENTFPAYIPITVRDFRRVPSASTLSVTEGHLAAALAEFGFIPFDCPWELSVFPTGEIGTVMPFLFARAEKCGFLQRLLKTEVRHYVIWTLLSRRELVFLHEIQFPDDRAAAHEAIDAVRQKQAMFCASRNIRIDRAKQ